MSDFRTLALPVCSEEFRTSPHWLSLPAAVLVIWLPDADSSRSQANRVRS